MPRTLYCGDITHPHLLFLHGFLGDKDDWKEMMQHLCPHYYCVAIDLPGHGKTPFTLDIENYLLTQISSLNLKNPTLIGYSMGGRLSLHLASQNPSLFKNVIVLSSHPGIQSAQEKNARLQSDQKWIKILENESLDTFLDKWYAQPLFDTLRHNKVLFDKVLERRKKNQNAELTQVLLHYSIAGQALLSTFPPSILFLHGEEDLKYADLYTELPKCYPVEAIAHAGHAIHLENPEMCAQTIKLFLEKNHANC